MTETTLPPNILEFTQRKRVELIDALLQRDQIATQDPKITSIGVKVLRDMDAADVSTKRLELDDKVAGDNAEIAKELIKATYNNIANGITPYVAPAPAPEPRQFNIPDDILPGYEPNEEIKGVGVSDRTYNEIMGTPTNNVSK